MSTTPGTPSRSSGRRRCRRTRLEGGHQALGGGRFERVGPYQPMRSPGSGGTDPTSVARARSASSSTTTDITGVSAAISAGVVSAKGCQGSPNRPPPEITRADVIGGSCRRPGSVISQRNSCTLGVYGRPEARERSNWATPVNRSAEPMLVSGGDSSRPSAVSLSRAPQIARDFQAEVARGAQGGDRGEVGVAEHRARPVATVQHPQGRPVGVVPLERARLDPLLPDRLTGRDQGRAVGLEPSLLEDRVGRTAEETHRLGTARAGSGSRSSSPPRRATARRRTLARAATATSRSTVRRVGPTGASRPVPPVTRPPGRGRSRRHPGAGASAASRRPPRSTAPARPRAGRPRRWRSSSGSIGVSTVSDKITVSVRRRRTLGLGWFAR